jgi:hypothetical protein
VASAYFAYMAHMVGTFYLPALLAYRHYLPTGTPCPYTPRRRAKNILSPARAPFCSCPSRTARRRYYTTQQRDYEKKALKALNSPCYYLWCAPVRHHTTCMETQQPLKVSLDSPNESKPDSLLTMTDSGSADSAAPGIAVRSKKAAPTAAARNRSKRVNRANGGTKHGPAKTSATGSKPEATTGKPCQESSSTTGTQRLTKTSNFNSPLAHSAARLHRLVCGRLLEKGFLHSVAKWEELEPASRQGYMIIAALMRAETKGRNL